MGERVQMSGGRDGQAEMKKESEGYEINRILVAQRALNSTLHNN